MRTGVAVRDTDTRGIGRFTLRAALGWGGLLLAAVPFLSLWLLVAASWPPLAEVDRDVAAGLNRAVSGSGPLVAVLRAVTDLGGTGTAVLLLTLATAFLLIRRQRRLAAFVATAGLGLAVLGPVTKALVDRARPVVESPVVEAPANASFPSGHSMTAVVVWGALALVALPSVRRRARPWLVTAVVLVAGAVGLTRLALGVHFVSDVLAGWALGAGWLAVTVAAFRSWQHDLGRHPREPLDLLEVPPQEGVRPAPDPAPALPGSRSAALRLLAVAGALSALLTGAGLLITAVLTETALGRWDRAATRWLVERRTPELTSVAEVVSTLAGTRTVIAVGFAVAVLAVAVLASWRPVVFVGVALVGEAGLYLAVAHLVDRARPAVADLTSGLPAAASWPSGHTAAAAALYGAVAALVVVQSRSRWRWAVLALPLVLAPAVGVSRVYLAAHHPTDVLAGLLLGATWVLACANLLLRPPGSGSSSGSTPRACGSATPTRSSTRPPAWPARSSPGCWSWPGDAATRLRAPRRDGTPSRPDGPR